jgi:hypothetical protein
LTQYIGIHSEGGLIPYDVLEKIAKDEPGLGQQPKDFGLPAGRRLTDEIARAWSDAQDYWHIFQRRTATLPDNETGATLTRKWVADVLELLGYELTLQQAGVVIGGKNYPISHRAGAGEEAPPVDIEGFRIDIDYRPQGRRLSPQALVQEYLNNREGHLWGIVTNGYLLRLLRETPRTSRPSYLEFDLRSILDGNRFNEFAIFYRVCHRSRLPKTAEDSASCLLEKYFQLSIEQGGRVRDKLRDGVEEALKTLGTGFLRHPENSALRERVKAGTLTPAEFHRQLLRLVYRLLFLMVAEERRMIVPEGPEADRRQSLYDRYYSVGRLRTLAEKPIEPSTFGDLWIGLRQTFSLFEDGDSNPLGIPPLNGDLFSAVAVKDLQGTHLYNDKLLAAMQRLSLFEDHRVRQRVNYSGLDVEELGSVYESLLDFQPAFDEQPEGISFELRTGSERKSTGSYYTRPELVRELIESALVPVMQDRLTAAKDADPTEERDKKQQAILSMSVCDPACGSGHFLLAAARRLGRELAKIKTGEEEPTPKEFHLAVRDVIAHCVYGVDVNPLAVDLCKLALWLEGHWTGKPLSFLDHRVKLGNSLIGVLDMEMLKEGIPDEAFNPVTGDDKKVASAFKKKNRDERKGQPSLPFDPTGHVRQYASESADYAGIAQDTPADVRRMKDAYEKTRQKPNWWHDWVAANVWTTAFFLPLTKYDDPVVPTHDKFTAYTRGKHVDAQMEGEAIGLATELHFFHWPLEFAEVYERGGFDVVLGNPPWEKVKLQEDEFFAIRSPEIANAPTASARKKLIAQLHDEHPDIYRDYEAAQRVSAATSKFVRCSNRYPLCGRGDINTYAIFAETMRRLLRPSGRIGCVILSGIATDETTRFFFQDLLKRREIVSFFDFENRKKLFPDVQGNMKFCLLTVGHNEGSSFRVAAQLDDPALLRDSSRVYTLTPDDIVALNPNSLNCPTLRTARDAEVLKAIHRHVPVLVRHGTPQTNPWNVSFLRMFDMTNDSDLFKTLEQLEGEGLELKGNLFRGEQDYFPLYEAKLAYQYNHRAATFEGIPAEQRFKIHAGTKEPDLTELQNPAFAPLPRFWVPADEAIERVPNKKKGLLGFRNAISAVADSRSLVACMLPAFAVGNSMPLLVCQVAERLECAMLATLNSFVLDYVLRQKASGGNLNFYIFEQLPIPPPEVFEAATQWSGSETFCNWILRRVLELTYTSWDFREFASACGYTGAPFRWNEDRRFLIRCEIDAAMFHAYGIETGDLEYILSTFPIVKKQDEQEYGSYRTAQVIREVFDGMQQAAAAGNAYQTRLKSEPADASLAV